MENFKQWIRNSFVLVLGTVLLFANLAWVIAPFVVLYWLLF